MSKTFLSLCSKTWSRSDSPVSSFHADSAASRATECDRGAVSQHFSVAESGRSNGSVKEFRFDPVFFPPNGPLLASPDVGIRGRARLRTGIVANMTASTVAQYLAALPADRRAALNAVRKATNENLPAGYEEGMQFGMIGWYVPLSVYPAGYGENPKCLGFPTPS